jgi:cytochrome c biogenesis protein CcmG/thiol:disulfide interchange protein DsbE
VSRHRRVLVAAPLLATLLAGCNASLTPPSYRPVKDPSLVTAAALKPCPTAGKPVSGGLPHLTLHCLDGSTTVDLAGLKGPMLINVWSSTCGPCKDEAPAVDKFRLAATGKVAVLGIDSDPYPDDGLNFAVKVGLHYPSLSDQHNDTPGKLKYATLPASYFLDATGHLVGPTQIAAFASVDEIKAAVKAHLGITVP